MHHGADRLRRVDGEDGRAGHGQGAGLGVRRQHPAVVRRGQAGETLGHAGLGLAGAGGGGAGFGGAVLGQRRIERSLCDEALRAQFFRALVGRPGVGQAGLGLRDAGLRLRHAGLGRAVVDHGQHLAGLHAVTGLDRQRGDASAGLGREHALVHRLQAAVELGAAGHRLRAHSDHGHLGPRRSGGRIGGLGSAHGEQAGSQQQARGADRVQGQKQRGVCMDGHGNLLYLPQYTHIPPGVQNLFDRRSSAAEPQRRCRASTQAAPKKLSAAATSTA